jgi:hypothetical protein
MSDPSTSKPTFSCARCFERKTKCDKRIPCGPCIKYNVQCIARPRRLSRKTRIAKDESVDERLKLYETLLRENGINPDQKTGTSIAELPGRISQPEVLGHSWTSPLDSINSDSQGTVFKPQLIQGQGGTKFVDK